MLLNLLPRLLITTMANLLLHPLPRSPHLTPQQRTLIPRPRRPPTAPPPLPLPFPTTTTTTLLFDLIMINGRPEEVEVGAPFGRDVVEEGGGGGHAAAEDGGGELGGGPEGGRLQVVGFVWAAGVEGDDEAHDGRYAGATGCEGGGSR